MPAKTPEECDAQFARYVNAGDITNLIALYEPRATLVQQDGSAAVGRPAIQEGLVPLLGMKPRITMNVIKVFRAGDDLAVLHNDWRLTAVDPTGTPLEMAGKAIEVVRRQADGTWLFAIDDPWARG